MPNRAIALGLLAALVCPGCGSDDSSPTAVATAPLPSIAYSDAKLLIEHNATDEDTGFQGFVDGPAWRDFRIGRPDGQTVVSVSAQGSLATFGLTELFFETQEPPNATVPIGNVLARLPPGSYQFAGTSVNGNPMTATALLTHDIPAGPVLTSPAPGAVVNPSNLVISWQPVTQSITGGPITIVAYQLIVEEDAPQANPNAFAHPKMSVHVPPTVTSVTVPPQFLKPGTPYKWEVLAIEQSGNQTLSSSDFETQ